MRARRFPDLDSIAAKTSAQRRELAFRVDDDQIIVRTGQIDLGDLVLRGLALARAGRTQDEPVAVHTLRAVDDHGIAGACVRPVEHASRLEQFL